MKLNTPTPTIRTHEGGTAKHINPEQQLRRSVMACMLWEDSFYESGESIAERIANIIPKVQAEKVAAIAIEAREKMKLRHVPLLIVRSMLNYDSHRKLVAATLASVIQRADELTEFLAIYWKEKRQPIAAQAKKGLAKAFHKFNAYSLAKYNRDGAIKLRDVLFLCHAKPKDEEQAATWKKLVDGKLESPDTWEVELSASQDKKASWHRLLSEDKLGAMALLRNLRNMLQAGIDKQDIRAALRAIKAERVLPFRFISAARYASDFEPELETAMLQCLAGKEKLPGKTLLMVDVSGSMDSQISGKSEIMRTDAAAGLAILLREVCDEVSIVTFSNNVVKIPPRKGFALRDAIKSSQPHGGTYLGQAIQVIHNTPSESYDRIIVITDEQAHDAIPDPLGRGVMINVAAYQNGVGYGPWFHLDGWSEAIVDYLVASEKDSGIQDLNLG